MEYSLFQNKRKITIWLTKNDESVHEIVLHDIPPWPEPLGPFRVALDLSCQLSCDCRHLGWSFLHFCPVWAFYTLDVAWNTLGFLHCFLMHFLESFWGEETPGSFSPRQGWSAMSSFSSGGFVRVQMICDLFLLKERTQQGFNKSRQLKVNKK